MTSIIDKREKKNTKFEALNSGQGFLWNDWLYMKTNDPDGVGLDLATGFNVIFSRNADVEPVNLKIEYA